jgi:hypothetical protein
MFVFPFFTDLRGVAQPSSLSQSPFQWLTSLPQFSSFQYRVPSLAHRVFPHRLDRDDSMKRCYQNFDAILDIKPGSPQTTASRVPFVAITAAPGCGKSFFLDELGALRREDIDRFCVSEEWRPSFHSALALKVSFNGWSSQAKYSDDRGELAICARLLYG